MKISRVISFLLIVVLLTAMGCRRTPQHVLDVMQSAEQMMEKHPDSALRLLERIDTTELYGKADKARRSLLLSMALDKNYIDTTDFRVLQPAIDYYELYGDADQRLKTRYYQGRIYMNRGEDDAALTAFLRAAEDSADCADTLALVRLLRAQGALYYRQYNLDKFIYYNQQIARIQLQQKDTAGALYALSKVLNAFTLQDKKSASDSLYKTILSLEKENPEYDKIARVGKLSYIFAFADTVNFRKEIQNSGPIEELDCDALLYVVDAYIQIKDSHNARITLGALKDREEEIDSIRYYSLLSDLEKMDGNYPAAYRAYERFTFLLETKNSNLIASEDLIVTDRYQNNSKSQQLLRIKDRKVITLIIIISIIILMSIYILIKWKKMRSVHEGSQLRQSILSKTYEQLCKEKDQLLSEKEQTMSGLVEKDLKIQRLQEDIENINQMMKENINVTIQTRRQVQEHIERISQILQDLTNQSKINKKLNKNPEDRSKLLEDLVTGLRMLYPEFMKYLDDCGLVPIEIEYVSLCTIGLNGKQIGDFLNNSRHYHISSNIRKKFGMDEHSTNLSIHIRQLLQEKLRD